MFGAKKKSNGATAAAELAAPRRQAADLAKQFAAIVRADGRPEVVAARTHYDRLAHDLKAVRGWVKQAEVELASSREAVGLALAEGRQPDRARRDKAAEVYARLHEEEQVLELAERRAAELESAAIQAAEEAALREFLAIYDALSAVMNRLLHAAAEFSKELYHAYEAVAPDVVAQRLRSRIQPRSRSFLYGPEGINLGAVPTFDPARAIGRIA